MTEYRWISHEIEIAGIDHEDLVPVTRDYMTTDIKRLSGKGVLTRSRDGYTTVVFSAVVAASVWHQSVLTSHINHFLTQQGINPDDVTWVKSSNELLRDYQPPQETP